MWAGLPARRPGGWQKKMLAECRRKHRHWRQPAPRNSPWKCALQSSSHPASRQSSHVLRDLRPALGSPCSRWAQKGRDGDGRWARSAISPPGQQEEIRAREASETPPFARHSRCRTPAGRPAGPSRPKETESPRSPGPGSGGRWRRALAGSSPLRFRFLSRDEALRPAGPADRPGPAAPVGSRPLLRPARATVAPSRALFGTGSPGRGGSEARWQKSPTRTQSRAPAAPLPPPPPHLDPAPNRRRDGPRTRAGLMLLSADFPAPAPASDECEACRRLAGGFVHACLRLSCSRSHPLSSSPIR